MSLALAGGCAKGGNGGGSGIIVSVTDESNGLKGISLAGLGLQIQITATVTGTSDTSVTWAILGSSCSGTGNPCGTLSATTGNTITYTAPDAVPSSPDIVVEATSNADKSATGDQNLRIVPITATVSPASLSVGKTPVLSQQFTAVAVPDNAPQDFTWTCSANGVPCVNFVVDSTFNGIATYTTQDNCSGSCVQISAVANSNPTGCQIDPKSCTIAKATIVGSRLASGTYAFQFNGYDNNGKPVAVAGTFDATNGSVTGGTETETTVAGTSTHAISGGSYTPSSADPKNSNNSGTLTLTTGAFPNQFIVVMDGAGDMQLIESDGHGVGAGIVQKQGSNPGFGTSNQTYAFGFAGSDPGGARVGMAGLVPIDGSGNVSGGVMDVNDNGNTTNVCGSAPCNLAGSYTYNSNTNVGHFTLTSGTTQHFDFYLAGGATNANNPLTIFAISTDPVDANHPTVSGTMVLQDSSKTYDTAGLTGQSISALVGANNNVSLTLGQTDGKGTFVGIFDQNNAGTVLTQANFPATGGPNYTYSAAGPSSNQNDGRYTIQMLGNPTASPAVPPLPFILYASGANRGFLLDQSSTAVMTGPMEAIPNKLAGLISPANMPGTFGLTIIQNANPSLDPADYFAANLLLTSPGNLVYNVTGTQNPGLQTVTGTYILNDGLASGSYTLTAPAKLKYAMYAVDTTRFYLIGIDSGVTSPLYLAQE